jgi:hypothetical protein
MVHHITASLFQIIFNSEAVFSWDYYFMAFPLEIRVTRHKSPLQLPAPKLHVISSAQHFFPLKMRMLCPSFLPTPTLLSLPSHLRQLAESSCRKDGTGWLRFCIWPYCNDVAKGLFDPPTPNRHHYKLGQKMPHIYDTLDDQWHKCHMCDACVTPVTLSNNFLSHRQLTLVLYVDVLALANCHTVIQKKYWYTVFQHCQWGIN